MNLYEKLNSYVKNKAVLKHVTYTVESVSSDFYPSGIPKMYRNGNKWVCIKSFDDMRGPLGVSEYLSEEEALQSLAIALDHCVEHLSDFYYYHPEWKKQ
ncbi:MAG: hypothetical protein E7394_01365 [Ruminococcaceae bacterium]|nr:hypothetical protein [Oscillospiraceae bacterium]